MGKSLRQRKRGRFLLGAVAAFALGVLLWAGAGEKENPARSSRLLSARTESGPAWQTYTNAAYHLTLQYPAAWQKDPRHDERYGGSGGFFSLVAVSAEGSTIDEVAAGEANHKLKPYGSRPEVRRIQVDGREGRLIWPAVDRPAEMENQAAVVVESPVPVQVGGAAYHYLILYADRQHIEELAGSLRFTASGGLSGRGEQEPVGP